MNTPLPFSIPANLGLDRITNNLPAIVALGRTMIQNAPRGTTKPCCAWDDSGLSLAIEEDVAAIGVSLLVDIGGSHTKVAFVDRERKMQMLFDYPNEWFEPASPSTKRPIESFFSRLCETIAQSIATRIQSDTPLRIGLIWSNQLRSQPFNTDTTQGTTGIITGKDLGSYRKGEWFLENLRNGDDLGQLFLSSLADNQLPCSVLLIGNDTVFTLFATPRAHAGIVVSSGANCTLVGPGSRGSNTIFNSELGGLMMIPSQLFSLGDQVYANTLSGGDIALEELCAGKWFADLMTAHVHALAKDSQGALFQPISEAFTREDIRLTNELVGQILREPEGTNRELQALPHASQCALKLLAQALVHRAGTLAGVLCFLSVSTLDLTSLKVITASLDSSLARHLPGFFNSATETFNALLPSGIAGSLVLVKPIQVGSDAELTPPMIGLARALQQYNTTPQVQYVRAACVE
jgi:hypothetical protein